MSGPAYDAAIAAGEAVRGTTSPNPPVGCALYDSAGGLIATGGTSPAGGPHAEVNALRAAGERAKGATAVVTLEPCNHTGRTGPCAAALADAGVSTVVYLTADPNPQAAGGASYLRSRGVEVRYEPRRVDALAPWLAALAHGRPSVTVKFAASVDGFTAAPDGSSKWITGKAAREHVHADRARRDAIVVGTGTALADDPALTARMPDGTLRDRQPRRVVVGTRKLPAGNLSRLGYEQYPTPEAALDALWSSGARDVLVEGGAGLATSFFRLGVVDRVRAYIAPVMLGAGRGVLDRALASTLADAPRYELTATYALGNDVVMEMEKTCSQD